MNFYDLGIFWRVQDEKHLPDNDENPKIKSREIKVFAWQKLQPNSFFLIFLILTKKILIIQIYWGSDKNF